MYVRQKQRCVIEFLHAEEIEPINIHRRLVNVYGADAVDVSTVRRWVRRFQSGDRDVSDKARSGRPCTSTTPENEARLDQLIRANRRITVNEMRAELDVGVSALETMLSSLGYSKVCARWVPRMLTQDQKDRQRDACQDLLDRYEAEGDGFLDRIITGDETWCHHHEPESKRQSLEWHHSHSPAKKKFKTQTSAGKVMCTVFWDRKGVILLDFLEPGATVNSDRYVETLTKLKARIARVRPEKRETFCLQHDNARPHTSLKTTECVAKFGWTVLSHPPYSPDLAPSDFHLFGALKDGLRGQHFPDNNVVIADVKKWTTSAGTDFYERGIKALVHRWRKCIENGGDYVEK